MRLEYGSIHPRHDKHKFWQNVTLGLQWLGGGVSEDFVDRPPDKNFRAPSTCQGIQTPPQLPCTLLLSSDSLLSFPATLVVPLLAIEGHGPIE